MREGESCTLECSLNSADRLKTEPVQWFRDLTPISNDNDDYRIKANGVNHSLTIYCAHLYDDAIFMAKCGDKEINAKVFVKEDPATFIVELKDTNFKLGQEKSILECQVSSETAEVQWKYNGKVISSDNHFEIISAEKSRSLVVTNATEADDGEYSCHMTKGKAKTSCKVVAMDSPFETDPCDTVVFIGDEINFDCRVKESNAQVAWSVNGQTSDDRFVTPKASGFDRKLTVKNAKMTDTGKILCQVKGHENKPVNCDLRVIEHLKIQKEPSKWEGKEGNEVEFVATTNKDCSATWYYNRKQVAGARFNESKSEDGLTYKLTFVAEADDDEAKIEVTLGGELKEFVSAETTMRVEGKGAPPKIGILEFDVVVPAGKPANICFELKGVPVAKATVINIDNNKEYKVERSADVKVERFIAIDRVERSDAGTFKITAKNDNGEDVQIINVSVIGPPEAPENLRVTKMTNDTCGFGWNAPVENGGDPIKRYSIEHRIAGEDWKQQFSDNDNCEFMLTKLPTGKMIEVRVAAENKAGVGSFCSPFGPTEINDGVFPPGFPTEVTVHLSGVRKDTVPLEWKVPSVDGGAPITGYEIEKCIDGSDSFEKCGESGIATSFEVKDVKDGKTYRFRVKAVNKAGVSGPSEPTANVLVEDPTNKPASPTTVVAENPATDSIDVTWNTPVNSTIPIENYIVEKLQHGHENWVQCAKVPFADNAVTVDELEQETKYIFRVFAENDCGRSVPSEMSNPCITLTGSGKRNSLIVLNLKQNFVCLSLITATL